MYNENMTDYNGFYLDMESLSMVYRKLYDRESRDVFDAGVACLFDENWHRYLKIGGPKTYMSHEFHDWYRRKGKNLPIVIFGVDGDARYVAELLTGQGYPVIAYCSNNDKVFLDGLDGMPVWSFEKMCANAKKNVIFLASSRFTNKLYEQCMYYTPLNEDYIYYPPRRRFVAYRGGQYFDFFEPSAHEVFVDGGAYDGRTTVDFVKWAGKDYDMSYVFEANNDNLYMCKNTLMNAGVDKYELVMKGLWDKSETVAFNSSLSTACRVDENGDSFTQMASLDEELSGKRVTFIKLDIEGGEYKALIGAREIIRQWKPKLAVSIYHKREDFVVLPLLIMQLLPEYNIAMRNYTSSDEERVLYAWID